MSDSFDFSLEPLDHFLSLFKEAEARGLPEPNAMTLSTINLQGHPASRIVLYKGIVRGGFSFYTNYQGQKGLELTKNPWVALNFFWPQLERQIRVEGQASRLTREESEAYFKTRDRKSQIGAWASLQSQVLPEYNELEKRWQEVEKAYQGKEIPCPPHWGGYQVLPTSYEFWFGRKGRLHERYTYQKTESGWKKGMKFP